MFLENHGILKHDNPIFFLFIIVIICFSVVGNEQLAFAHSFFGGSNAVLMELKINQQGITR